MTPRNRARTARYLKRDDAQTRRVSMVALPLTVERAAADKERLEVPVAISSERRLKQTLVDGDGYPIERNVMLVHSEKAVDLADANSKGIPVRIMHERGLPLARVFEPRLDKDRVLRGMMRFSRSASGKEKFQDVTDGILTDLSVGAELLEYNDDGDDMDVVRWRPVEVSLVDVGLDPAAGVYRADPSHGNQSHTKPDEDKTMSDNDGRTTDSTGGQATAVSTLSRSQKILEMEAGKRARIAERARLSEIDGIFDMQSVPKSPLMQALRAQAIDDGWTADATRKAVLEQMASDPTPDLGTSRQEPVQPSMPPAGAAHRDGLPGGRTVTAGADACDKLAGLAEKVLMVRSGIEQDQEIVREVRASGRHDYSAFDLGTELLRASNVDTVGKSKRDIAGILLRAGSHSNADFPSILANVATKAAMRGWTETPTTWQMWANTGSLPDFKAATIAGLGAYPDLDLIPRSGGPYNEHSMDDVHETAQLATYGGLFSIGRQTLIDDDLDAFTRVPMKMGAAASRKVNGLAYTVLTNGTSATMTQDGVALFASGHSNYVTAGAAPSTTTLDAGFTAMAKQTPPTRSGETSTAYLNISPQYLIVPKALETTSRVLATSTYDPAGTTASVAKRDAPNPFQGRIEVVADALLDASNTAGWYLAAPRGGVVDTVTVFFLNGQQDPFIEEHDHGSTSDGVTWKVRIDAVAVPLDFRGLYYNDGVT